jgi:zinc protease
MQPKPTVYIVDRPGSQQSIIFAGHVAVPKSNPQEIAIEAMNNVLGGLFTSRINMNLREDKHWSYGAFSLLFSARGQRPFIGYAPVQTDKTKESMKEVLNELQGIVGAKPATMDELQKVQNSMTLELPGSWETNGAVAGSIGDMVRYGLPDDYYATYPGKVRALGLQDLGDAAKTVVHPGNLTWVVVGDRAKIEAGIRELNFGEIRFLDSDGNPVK